MIKLKLGGKIYSDLAVDLGYRNIESGVERLKKLEMMESTFAWLQSDSYDLKYSNEEFLVKLCKLLVISPVVYEDAISKAKKRLFDLNSMHKPYIKVETDFKRKGENWMSLSHLFHQTRLEFDKEPYLYVREKEFLELVSSMIKKHYQETNGELEYLGKVVGYTFFDRHGIAHNFDTSGNKIFESYEDIDAYLKRYRFEHEESFYNFDSDLLFSMLYQDIYAKLKKMDLPYFDRLKDRELSEFESTNIQHFIDKVKNIESDKELFILGKHSMLIYIEAKEEALSICYMPIDTHFLEDYTDKNRLYKSLYSHLLKLASEDNIVENHKVSYADKVLYRVQKDCIDYLYVRLAEGNISLANSYDVYELLKEMFSKNIITKEEFLDSFMKFARLLFQMKEYHIVSVLASYISKSLVEGKEDKYFYYQKIMEDMKRYRDIKSGKTSTALYAIR